MSASTSTSDKSVRDCPVTAKLVRGDVRVECKRSGIMFGFPLAVWPETYWQQAEWIRRLTPWWDLSQPDWSPQAQRFRDSCQVAINKLSSHMQNLVTTATANAVETARLTACAAAPTREIGGECVCEDYLSAETARPPPLPLALASNAKRTSE